MTKRSPSPKPQIYYKLIGYFENKYKIKVHQQLYMLVGTFEKYFLCNIFKYSNINNNNISIIMKLMYQINNNTSYAVDKIMHQSHAPHLDDIHNSQATKAYIRPDSALSQQHMKRYSTRWVL